MHKFDIWLLHKNTRSRRAFCQAKKSPWSLGSGEIYAHNIHLTPFRETDILTAAPPSSATFQVESQMKSDSQQRCSRNERNLVCNLQIAQRRKKNKGNALYFMQYATPRFIKQIKMNEMVVVVVQMGLGESRQVLLMTLASSPTPLSLAIWQTNRLHSAPLASHFAALNAHFPI